MKKLILTDEDFYNAPHGRCIRGGNSRLYEAELVVYMKDNGDFEIVKDRFGMSKDEIRSIIEFDERILLAL
jgi:hypothetical protein